MWLQAPELAEAYRKLAAEHLPEFERLRSVLGREDLLAWVESHGSAAPDPEPAAEAATADEPKPRTIRQSVGRRK